MTPAGTGPANRLRERLRDAVRDALQPPASQDLDLDAHGALLELSRDSESKIRLVTTNFDTLFERAWPRQGVNLLKLHLPYPLQHVRPSHRSPLSRAPF